jgi:hypothetical protein
VKPVKSQSILDILEGMVRQNVLLMMDPLTVTLTVLGMGNLVISNDTQCLGEISLRMDGVSRENQVELIANPIAGNPINAGPKAFFAFLNMVFIPFIEVSAAVFVFFPKGRGKMSWPT